MNSLDIKKSPSDPFIQSGRVFQIIKQPTLRTVNISSFDDLQYLTLTLSPFITALKVDPSSLTELYINNNSLRGDLETLFTKPLSSSPLQKINVNYNYFTDFKSNSSLMEFDGKFNQFRNLNFINSGKLKALDVSNNLRLSSLVFSPADPSDSGTNSININISYTSLSSFSLSAAKIGTITSSYVHLTSFNVITNVYNNVGVRSVPSSINFYTGGTYTPLWVQGPKLSSIYISGKFSDQSHENINYDFRSINNSMDLRNITLSSNYFILPLASSYSNYTWNFNFTNAIQHANNREFENFTFGFSAIPGVTIHDLYPTINLNFTNHSLTSFIGSRCLKGLNVPKNVHLLLPNGKINTIDVTSPCYFSTLDFTSNPITDRNINLSCLSVLSTFKIGALSARSGNCYTSISPFLNAANNTMPLSSITFPVDNRIEELVIINSRLSSIDLAPFKKLKRLNLAWNRDLKTVGIKNLSACSDLRYFNIVGCGFSTAQLTQIWDQLPTIPLDYIWNTQTPRYLYGSDSEGLYYNYNGVEETSTTSSEVCPITRPTYQGGSYGDTQKWIDKRWRINSPYQLSSLSRGMEYWLELFALYY